MLPVGTQAPDFTLPDKDGCTRQACAFAKAQPAFAAKNAVIVGVSRDSAASHQKFAAKYGLPFVLLSDPETAVLQLYDVWKEKKLYGKASMGVVRSTYLIDERGVIAAALPKVKPDDNAAQMLALL